MPAPVRPALRNVISLYNYNKWKAPSADSVRPRDSIILHSIITYGLLINTLVEDPANALLGLCVPAVGAVAYALFDLRLRRQGSSQ